MKLGKRISQFYRETVGQSAKAKLVYIPDYGLGQGIGLSPKEVPVLAQGDRTVLSEGMCFSLRLDIRHKEVANLGS